MRSSSTLHARFLARDFAPDDEWLRVASTMVREQELLEVAQLRTSQLAAEVRRYERTLRRRLARRASVEPRWDLALREAPAGSDSRAPRLRRTLRARPPPSGSA